jgi:2-oxoglutarate dehydrogenase E2 component (dihydrolipoamide succinyltransferase)
MVSDKSAVDASARGVGPSKLQRIAVMATEIRVPKIGVSTVRASIGRWFKRVGGPVSADEPLVEIETDGATVEVAASATGVLSQIFLRDGAKVEAGTLLGTITEYATGNSASARLPR